MLDSSRTWAAKGVKLTGVKAVIAESFERIHRTNRVGMGVLALRFQTPQKAASLGLAGTEMYHIDGVKAAMETGTKTAVVRAVEAKGAEKVFTVDVRVDTPQEWEY